jgi:superoxide dismutase, Fe-Mn family
MNYTPKKFNLPTLFGISDKQVAVHLALYEGYVKHYNLIGEKLANVRSGAEALDPYIVAELRRRVAFEFNGARLHEYYFEQFERGSTSPEKEGAFADALKEKYGEQGLEGHIREVAQSRGIGWVIVYFDPMRSNIVTTFVADHELGQLAGLPILLALDLWEHAFMVDYVPAEKKSYIDAFFANVNWSVVEKRFVTAMSAA